MTITALTTDVISRLKSSSLHCAQYDSKRDVIRVDERYISRTLQQFASNMSILDESDLYGDGGRYISATVLLNNFTDYISTCADSGLIGDCDVTSFIRDLTPVVMGSASITDKEQITQGEYYLYLTQVANSDNPYVITDGGEIYKLTGAQFTTSLFGVYISARFRQLFMIGEQAFPVNGGTAIHGKKFKSDDLPVRQATSDEIAVKAEYFSKYLANYKSTEYKEYNGIAYTPGMMGDVIEHFVDGQRVVVDSLALKRRSYGQLRGLIGCSYGNIDTDESTTIEDLQSVDANVVATLIDGVAMFDLDNKRWLLGKLVNLSEVTLRGDAFEKLILGENKKNMIKAIATKHKVENTDIIAGKGSNAIFLLHGVPGTGKTLTAEAVAEYMGKPLYKVSLGELGTEVDELENEIKEILALCSRWDAIVLIDEADVFLEKRNADNLVRNAMVAVFLRTLEYYEGILFLTTNRAREFDEAFISRITMAIHYARPDMEQLWTMLLDNSKIQYGDSDITSLKAYEVNGRQAKSAINTAKALAAFGEVEPSVSMIQQSLDETIKFQDFLAQD